jgi:hypothetical protein
MLPRVAGLTILGWAGFFSCALASSEPSLAAIFRNGSWFFDLDGKGGTAEKAFSFGIPGDVPMAGSLKTAPKTPFTCPMPKGVGLGAWEFFARVAAPP